jgi:multiple sugar transport system permease protein
VEVGLERVKGAEGNRSVGVMGKMVGARTVYQTRQAMLGYLFALPWILGLIIFWGGPILVSFYFSFTEYAVIGSPRFIGLENFVTAFTNDDLFWPSLGRTFNFTFLFVPTAIAGAMLLAVLLNQKLKGTNIYRTIFFVPHLIPAVALAVLWIYLLQPQLGPINYFLRQLGVQEPPGWLAERDWALFSVTMINVWAYMGGNAMLIFLAGLQGVPKELYEASDIDGANFWDKFWNVTLPMISPMVLFNVVLVIIASLKVFTTAWVATKGGPSYATWFFALHIYQQAFQYFRLGYGSALAWMLAVLLIVFTLLQLWLSRRWVHYEGETEGRGA